MAKKVELEVFPILIHPTVSTEWVVDSMHLDSFTIVDATMPRPGQKTDPRTEFEKGHIPGAVFVNIDECSSGWSGYPHMLASSFKFARAMGRLGIGNEPIIVYDQHGMFSAARFWWMLHCYSHPEVSVMDGGMPKWLKENKPLEPGIPARRRRSFHPWKDRSLVADRGYIEKGIPNKKRLVIDARSPERYAGKEAEPHPGLRKGHISGSINIHYKDVLERNDCFKSREELRILFESRGVRHSHDITVSCGSGVTAAIVALALKLADFDNVRVYDGSWAEWGSSKRTTVRVGAKP